MQALSLTRQRALEDEESRKAERNRVVFEAWLEKKREERKKERASKMEALRRDEEEWEKRRGIGQMVFERWLKKKQAEDKVTKKQLCKQSELDRLKKEEMRDRQQQSEAAFSAWKRHKDVEWEMERQFIKHQHRSITPPIREPTPTLPGYCSVWSCDEHMARHFVTRVRRSAHSTCQPLPLTTIQQITRSIIHYHTPHNF